MKIRFGLKKCQTLLKNYWKFNIQFSDGKRTETVFIKVSEELDHKDLWLYIFFFCNAA
jgi:hypothetical protein